MNKNRWYWVAFLLSLLFGLLTFFTATEPREFLGVISSIALCVVCAIKIYGEDDEYEDEDEDEGGEF